MSEINIDVDLVESLRADMAAKAEHILLIRGQTERLINSLSPDVLGRRGIEAGLRRTIRDLTEQYEKMEAILGVVSLGARLYREADDELYRRITGRMLDGRTAEEAGLDGSGDPEWVRAEREIAERKLPLNVVLGYLNGHNVDGARRLIRDGVAFKTVMRNGKRYIRLVADRTKGLTWKQLGRLLEENVAGDAKWTRYNLKTLTRGDGIPLFAKKLTKEGQKLFGRAGYKPLSDFVKDLGKGTAVRAANGFRRSFKEEINYAKQFKPGELKKLTKLGKAAKVAGAVSSVFDAGDAVISNCYRDGKWTLTPTTIIKSAGDAAISFGTGATAMSTGAAIGSFLAPPVGTVVGALTGGAINFAINTGIADVDGDGKKDSAVGIIKIGAHKVVDAAEKKIKSIADSTSKAFKKAGKFFKSLF